VEYHTVQDIALLCKSIDVLTLHNWTFTDCFVREEETNFSMFLPLLPENFALSKGNWKKSKYSCLHRISILFCSCFDLSELQCHFILALLFPALAADTNW